MSAAEDDPNEEEFASLMAAWDEAMAARKPVGEWTAPRTPAEFGTRLERDLACAQLVRAVLRPAAPSGGASPPPDAAGSEPAPSSRLPWTNLGRFELRRELGRGGFGTVFLAYDPLLDREVALKVPHVDVVLTSALRDRFLREARAASGLDHPNLVPVFEVGEVGPVCFLVSAYSPGTSLAHWLKDHADPVPFREAARLVATLAEALEHAHNRGVIHRDLKPANILLQGSRESGVGSREEGGTGAPSSLPPTPYSLLPKITDFGLAKHLGGAAGDGLEPPTRTGTILGTPCYMAPEQAGGKVRAIGPGVDIYALGAILYELLTRRPPFQGESDLETLLLAQTDEPVPPSRLRPRLPRDLETICLKCLHKDPARRYARAGDLADDLHRFLGGAPVKARPVGLAARLARWCRRKPLLAGLLAVVALALAAVVTVVALAYVETRAAWSREALAAEDARLQRQVALEQRDAAQRHLYFAQMHQAEQAWKEGEFGRLHELLSPYNPGSRQADLRGWEWYYLRARCRLLRLRGHTGTVGAVAWSHDGRWLASAGVDGTTRVWNASTGEEVRTCRDGPTFAPCVTWNPKRDVLAAINRDGTVSLWEPMGRTAPRVLQIGAGAASKVTWSPDGNLLASLHNVNPRVRVWQAADGQMLKFPAVPRGNVKSLAWCGDGRHLAAGTDLGEVLVWDLLTGLARTLGRQEGQLFALAWSPDGKRVAAVGNGTTGMIWSLASDNRPVELAGHGGTIWSVAWSPDGRRVATASADGTIRLWDPATGKEVHAVRSHTGAVAAMAWSPDGLRLASGSTDETAAVVSATPPEDGRTLAGHKGWVWGLSWSPDGRRLAAASDDDRRARIWDPGTGRTSLDFRNHANYVLTVAWAPDGRSVATADYDGIVKIWDSDTGNERGTLRAHEKPVRSVAWRPDGQYLASGSDDGTIRLWEVSTRSLRSTLVGHNVGSNVRHLAWSPDGRRLASAGSDQTARVWDAPTGQLVATLRGHHASVAAVAWSADGTQLATASFDGTVKVWETAAFSERLTLRGHAGAVLCLAWSPTGRLASGGGDIKIWDPSDGAETLTLKGHTGAVQALAWSPDGRRLASGSWDRTIKIWDATPGHK